MPLTSTIVTLLIFTVIVVVHEWGHFIVARRNGVLVEEFAVGFGPILLSWQRGETLFSIRAIPLGGYCKMLDGEPDEINDPRAFISKSVWQRISILIAGSIMNFLLAVLLGVILISATFVSTTSVATVISNSPAEAAGIMPGDRIVRIDGSTVHSFEHIGRALTRAGGNEIDIVIRRDGFRQTFSLAAEYTYNEATGQSRYLMGISIVTRAGFLSPMREYAEVATLAETLRGAWGLSVYSVTMVLDGLAMLASRQVGMDDMLGPIGVGQVIDTNLQAAVEAQVPVRNMAMFGVQIAMLLSANLAVLNLLPIPALDGGRITLLTIEGIRRKPLQPEREGWIHLAGFAIVIGLAVMIAFNDILRIVR